MRFKVHLFAPSPFHSLKKTNDPTFSKTYLLFQHFFPPIGPKIYWKFSIIFNFPNFHVMYVAPRASSLISSYKGFTRLPLTHTRTHTRARARGVTFHPGELTGVRDRSGHQTSCHIVDWIRFCGGGGPGQSGGGRKGEREREKWLGCLFLLRGLTWRRLREPETDGVFIHGCEEIRETTKRSCIRWKLIWILFSLPLFRKDFLKDR